MPNVITNRRVITPFKEPVVTASGGGDPIGIFGSGCQAWWDGSDAAQITLNTTPDPERVSSWVSKGENALDLAQATESAQPSYNAANGYLDWDTVNKFLEVGTIDFSGFTDVDVYVLCQFTSVLSHNGTIFVNGTFGPPSAWLSQDGAAPSAFSTLAALGDPTVHIDDSADLTPLSRDVLHDTYASTGNELILELRNASLTGFTTSFRVGGDQVIDLGGRIKQIVITDAGTSQQRADMQTFLNSK